MGDTPSASSALPADYEELRKAPDHLVELLAPSMYLPTGPKYPPGSEVYQAALRQQARLFADRIWAEAAHAGAAWGLARNTNVRIEVTGDPEQLERLAALSRTTTPQASG